MQRDKRSIIHRACCCFLLLAALIARSVRADDAASHQIKLPAKVDDIVVAANGDILLLQMDTLSKLAVFDIKTEKILGYVSLGGNQTAVAGTANSIILVVRDKNIVQRWSLPALEKKLTLPLTLTQEVDGVAAGYASSGPFMIMTRGGPRFMDSITLKLVETNADRNGMWNPHPQYPLKAAASADGSTYAALEPGLSPSGLRYLRFDNGQITTKYQHTSVGEELPSADGSLIFTSSGVYNSDLQPLDRDDRNHAYSTFPTLSPAYYLGIARSGNQDQRTRSPS